MEKWDYLYKSHKNMCSKLIKIRNALNLLSLKEAFDYCIESTYNSIVEAENDLQNKKNK